jgi:GDP-L-fucose synthase
MNFLVTGGSGMVGAAILCQNPDAIFVNSSEYDLTSYGQTRDMFDKYSPENVIHLAAKVGGVGANSNYLGDFYTENIEINTNVLKCAQESGTKKVVSLLSTCIYPDKVTYPLTEDQIHNGPPHQSNYAYAYAKRMLDIQSQAYRDQHGCNFITAVPNNLFGENDNFHLENSHLIPAIIRKMHEAKQDKKPVVLWGDGTPLREFTYSQDLAKILLFLLDSYDERSPVNVGNTKEYSVKEVSAIIADIVGFTGEIRWDTTRPNGQHRKPSDNKNLIDLGWKAENYTDFKKALTKTYEWFTMNYPHIRGIQ